MSKTSFAVAAVVAFAALAGGISSASAGGNHMHMQMHNMHNGMHNNFFRHRPRLGIIIANSGVGCGYLYDRWLATGDYFWKRKYYLCRRGW